jgi:hypothetical protein
VAISAGAVAVSANFALVDVMPSVKAFIGNGADVTVSGAALIRATIDVDVAAEVLTASGGGGALGASIATANMLPDVQAYIAPLATLRASTITIQARVNHNGTSPKPNRRSRAVADSPSVSLGLSGTGSIATANASGAASAYVAGGASLHATSAISVQSHTSNVALADANGLSLSLGAALGASVANATASGSTASYLNGSVTNGSSLSVLSDAKNDATATADSGSGSLGVSGNGGVANANVMPFVRSSVGDSGTNGSISVSGNVVIKSESAGTASGVAEGFSVGGIFGAGVMVAGASLEPRIDTFVGGATSITAGGGVTPESAHNRAAPSDAAFAKATLTAGGPVAGAAAGSASATDSPMLDTGVRSDASVDATGDVVLRSNSAQDATVDARSVGVGLGGGVGFVRPNAVAGGTVLTHFDGELTAANSLTMTGEADAEAAVEGRAGAGGLGAAPALVTVDAETSPSVLTYIEDVADVTATNDIGVTSLATTDVTATASAFSLSAGLAVGAVTVNAESRPDVDAEIRGGATVASTAGSVAVLAAHNYDPGPVPGVFLTSKDVRATTDVKSGGTVNVGVATINAISEADVNAAIGSQIAPGLLSLAKVNAAQTLSVESRSTNVTDARSENVGGGIANIQSSTPTSRAAGTTTASLFANVTDESGDNPGAASVAVTAQGVDNATAGATNDGGGGLSISSSVVLAESSPNVSAEAGGDVRSSGGVSIKAVSTPDADASSDGIGIGIAVSISSLNATALVDPDVAAGVAADSTIAAQSLLEIEASHGQDPPIFSDGTFDAATDVNRTTNTVTLGGNHGLQTGDTVVYDALVVLDADGVPVPPVNPVVGGLSDLRSYGVIYVSDTALQLGTVAWWTARATSSSASMPSRSSSSIRWRFRRRPSSSAALTSRPMRSRSAPVTASSTASPSPTGRLRPSRSAPVRSTTVTTPSKSAPVTDSSPATRWSSRISTSAASPVRTSRALRVKTRFL